MDFRPATMSAGQHKLKDEEAATKIQAVYRGQHVRHGKAGLRPNDATSAGSHADLKLSGVGKKKAAPVGPAARPREGQGQLSSVDAQGWSTETWDEVEYAKLSLEDLVNLCRKNSLSTVGEKEQLIRRLLGYDCLDRLAVVDLQRACKERSLSQQGDHQALVLRLLECLGKLPFEQLQHLCREQGLRVDGEAGTLLLRYLRSAERTLRSTKEEEPGGEKAKVMREKGYAAKEKAVRAETDFGTEKAVLHLREKKEQPLIHYPKLKSLDATLKKLEEDKERWEAKFGRVHHKLDFLSTLLAEFKHEHEEVGWSPASRHAHQEWLAMHMFLQVHYAHLAKEVVDNEALLKAERMQKMKNLKDVGAAGEHRGGLEGLFDYYASLKCAGKRLMRRPDWAHFLHDFHIAHPKVKGIKDADHMMKVWEDYIELQKDMCVTYGLERSEAAKGLCFDTFQTALHSVIPSSFYHAS